MSKENDSMEKTIRKADASLSVWKIAGLTALILLVVVTAAILISGGGKGKKQGNGVALPAAADSDLLYEIPADKILSMKEVEGKLVLVLQDEVRYLDDHGIDVAVNAHSYANPVVRTAGKNLLLFDKGGTSLRLEKNAEVFDEITTASAITCADVAPNGNYAYVLNAEGGFQSHLYVFSYKGEKLYEWGSASDYILGVTLSGSGNYVVVNELTVNNAEPVSRVLCFRFGDEEPLFSVELHGVTVYGTKFISKNNVIVYTDSGITRIGKNAETEEILTYSQNELNHSVLSYADLCAVSLNRFGNEKNVSLTVFDKKFKKMYEAQPDAEITMMDSSPYAVAVLAGSRVCAFNAYGTLTAVAEPPEKCFDLFVLGHKVFVSTASGLYAYPCSGSVPD